MIRLLPFFYLSCVIAILIGGTDQGRYYLAENNINVGNVIAHFLLVYGFNPFWINSILGVEWYLFTVLVIYIFIPVLMDRIDSLRCAVELWMISIPVTIVLNVFLKAIDPLNNPTIWYNYVGGLNILGHIPAVLTGIFLYYFNQRKSNVQKEERNMSYSLLMGVATLLVLITFSNIKYSTILWDILCGFIVLSQLLWSSKIVEFPIFTVLGKRSYEIYLTHILLIQWLKRMPLILNNLLADWFLKYIILVIASFLIGYIYHELETRILKYISRHNSYKRWDNQH